MNTANIARSLVGGIIKSSDIGLKNHALGLFYAELKVGNGNGNSESTNANANAKQTLKQVLAKSELSVSKPAITVIEPAPVTIPVAEQIAETDAPEAEPSEVATEAVVAVNGTSEDQFRALGQHETINVGDEWILRDEFRHNHGGERRWRTVADAVGRTPSNYPKSNFRRRM